MISNITNQYPLIISQLFYNNSTRTYEMDGPSLVFPAFVKKSQVKFNFKTQNKPYAVIQDLPDYVSTINRSYDLEFEVIGSNTVDCIENYKYLHEFLKLMKSNYEKSRDITVAGVNDTDKISAITSYAINNMYLNSRANFRIQLESNPFIYNPHNKEETTWREGNTYDILMTSFDYKIDESHGYFDTDLSLFQEEKRINIKKTLIPVSYSISLGGLLLPENPNIYRQFKTERRYVENKTKTIKLGTKVNEVINNLYGSTQYNFETMVLTQEQIKYLQDFAAIINKMPGDASSDVANNLRSVINEQGLDYSRRMIESIIQSQPKE